MTPATQHTWIAAGRPGHPYDEEGASGVCSVCAAPTSSGVPLKKIETANMANHADFFRFGKHVCPACAWLFAVGKSRPGNYIAYGDKLEYVVISHDSVVEDKRPWLDVLKEITTLPSDTPIAGVMTTDVKRRLWPLARLATVEKFGLYLHVNDYDVSEWRVFDLKDCLIMAEMMIDALGAGFAKASLYHGLLRDHGRTAKTPYQVAMWERKLVEFRKSPAFLPALIVAGIKKVNV